MKRRRRKGKRGKKKKKRFGQICGPKRGDGFERRKGKRKGKGERERRRDRRDLRIVNAWRNGLEEGKTEDNQIKKT